MTGFILEMIGVFVIPMLLLTNGYLLQDSSIAPNAQTDHSEILHLKSLVDGLITLTNSIQNDVASKDDVIQRLHADVSSLNTSLHIEMSQRTMVDRRLQDLQIKQRDFTGTTDQITEDVGTLQQQTSSLQTEMTVTKLSISTLATQTQQLNQTVQTQLQQISTSLSTAQTTNPPTTAPGSEKHLNFMARKVSGTSDLHGVKDLSFSVATGSSTLGYNTTLGTFIAPWKGVYWFGMKVLSFKSEFFDCYICCSPDDWSAQSIANRSTASDHVIMSVNVGEFVSVRCIGLDEGNIVPDGTYFSGFFINSE